MAPLPRLLNSSLGSMVENSRRTSPTATLADTSSPLAIRSRTIHSLALNGSYFPLKEKAASKVGGVAPPTMSVPTRSQSGCKA